MVGVKIPLEVKDAAEALGHPIRLKIVEYLYDGHMATYTELLNMLGIRKGSLTYHLKILGLCGIVYSKQRLGELGDFHRARYELAPWGKIVGDSLLAGYYSVVSSERVAPGVAVGVRGGAL